MHAFGVPKRSVELVRGGLSRSKVFLLKGLDRTKAESILQNLAR